MYQLRVSTWIHAPVATCFDLARSVEAHLESASETGERVVGGRRSGLLELGDEVTWEGRHFGIRQRLAVRITAIRRPSYFQDTMTRGAFCSFEHDHLFEPRDDGTLMTDVLTFRAPYGPLGWLLERLLLGPHLRRFLELRGGVLKRVAEGDSTFGA